MHELMCHMCHTKHDTNSLHQLNMIIRNLERVIGKEEVEDERVEELIYRFGGRCEMFEVGLHCRYGLHCSEIERTKREMSRIADRVPRLIVQASLINAGAVYPILRMMGGYFPRAYRFTQEVLGYATRENVG